MASTKIIKFMEGYSSLAKYNSQELASVLPGNNLAGTNEFPSTNRRDLWKYNFARDWQLLPLPLAGGHKLCARHPKSPLHPSYPNTNVNTWYLILDSRYPSTMSVPKHYEAMFMLAEFPRTQASIGLTAMPRPW